MSSPAIPSFTEFSGHRIACLSYLQPAAGRLPVVWVHGLTASVRFWQAAMYDEIWQQRDWYSISLPFHHPSTYAGPYSADSLDEHLFAELMARSVDRLIPKGKFHLVGYSLGGFACLNYAAKFPDRVASIISIGGFMTGRAQGLEGVLQFIAQGKVFRRAVFHLSWWVMQRHVVFLKLATIFYARRWRQLLAYPYLDPTLRDIFPDVSQHDINGQRALFRYLLDMNLMDEVDGIVTPTLVIAGASDPIIPCDHQKAYAARLSRSELLLLPGVGHVAFAEAPGEFRRGVLDWLRRYD